MILESAQNAHKVLKPQVKRAKSTWVFSTLLILALVCTLATACLSFTEHGDLCTLSLMFTGLSWATVLAYVFPNSKAD